MFSTGVPHISAIITCNILFLFSCWTRRDSKQTENQKKSEVWFTWSKRFKNELTETVIWRNKCFWFDMEQNCLKQWISGFQAMGTLYNLS